MWRRTCNILNKIDDVRREITRVLPGVKVIETGTNAFARMKALKSTVEKGNAELVKELKLQDELKNSRTRSIYILGGVVGVSVLVWFFFLSLRNIKERQEEIGAYRAMGCSAPFIAGVLLARPALMGLAGGVLGTGMGIGASALFYFREARSEIEFHIAAVAAGGAVVAVLVSGLLPVLRAVYSDPVNLLNGK